MQASQKIEAWLQKNSNLVIAAVVSVVVLFIVVSFVLSTLKYGKKMVERHKRQAKKGIQKKVEDWPQRFQQIHAEYVAPSTGELNMSVCWALGMSDGEERVAICKLSQWPNPWRSFQTRLNLQRVDETTASLWRMNPSSVKDDLRWWPKSGDRAEYFASKNFIEGAKDDYLQVARLEDGVIYIHYTLKKGQPEKE